MIKISRIRAVTISISVNLHLTISRSSPALYPSSLPPITTVTLAALISEPPTSPASPAAPPQIITPSQIYIYISSYFIISGAVEAPPWGILTATPRD